MPRKCRPDRSEGSGCRGLSQILLETPGVLDHRGQVATRGPAQQLAGAVVRRHEYRRVAGPAWRLHHGDEAPRHVADAGEHLAYRIARSAPEIDDVVPTRLGRGQGPQMRLAEVDDVDVVAHAGAVGGVVVRTEQAQLRRSEERGV